MVARGKGGGGGRNWESGVSRCKLLYIGWINNRVLLYSTGNSIEYPKINHNGKEYEKECIDIYITESLCCIAEINTTLYINYTSIKFKKKYKCYYKEKKMVKCSKFRKRAIQGQEP